MPETQRQFCCINPFLRGQRCSIELTALPFFQSLFRENKIEKSCYKPIAKSSHHSNRQDNRERQIYHCSMGKEVHFVQKPNHKAMQAEYGESVFSDFRNDGYSFVGEQRHAHNSTVTNDQHKQLLGRGISGACIGKAAVQNGGRQLHFSGQYNAQYGDDHSGNRNDFLNARTRVLK